MYQGDAKLMAFIFLKKGCTKGIRTAEILRIDRINKRKRKWK